MDSMKKMDPIHWAPTKKLGGGWIVWKDSPEVPQAPAAPDPAAQIAAEARANRYNIRSPFGNQTWEGPNAGENTLNIALDPSQRRQFDLRNQIAETLMNRARTQIPQIPSQPFQFDQRDPRAMALIDEIIGRGVPQTTTGGVAGGAPWGQLAGGGYDPRTQFDAGGQARTGTQPNMGRDLELASQRANMSFAGSSTGSRDGSIMDSLMSRNLVQEGLVQQQQGNGGLGLLMLDAGSSFAGGADPRAQFDSTGAARTSGNMRADRELAGQRANMSTAQTTNTQAATNPAANPVAQQPAPDTSPLGSLVTAYKASKSPNLSGWLASQTGANAEAITSLFNAQKASNPNLTWQQFMAALPKQITGYKAPVVQAAVQQNTAPPSPPPAASPVSSGGGTSAGGLQPVNLPLPAADTSGGSFGKPQPGDVPAAPAANAVAVANPSPNPMPVAAAFNPQPVSQRSGDFIDTLASGRAREQAQPFQLSGSFNPQVDGSAVKDATYRQMTGLLDRHFDREETRLDQKLANQGIPMGSEAFQRDFGDFGIARDQSYERAADSAVRAGAEEEARQFARALAARGQDVGEQFDTRRQNVGETQAADQSNLQRAIAAVTGSLSGDQVDMANAQGMFGRSLAARQQQVGETDADYQRYLQSRTSALGALTGLEDRDRANSLTQRQQNYNELAALLGGQQLNPISPQASPLDVSGAFARNQAAQNMAYQGQIANYNSGVAGNNSMMGGLFSLGSSVLGAPSGGFLSTLFASDRRLKRDVVWTGKLPNGLNVYEYEYVWGGGRTTGVMADEVETVMPEAVVVGPHGYAMVDYGRLLAGMGV